jgi:fructose-bisphosphate aldolase class 1
MQVTNILRATGASFAKFRAVFKVDALRGHPSIQATELQANTLARYASIAQQAGLVPIVEVIVTATMSFVVLLCSMFLFEIL